MTELKTLKDIEQIADKWKEGHILVAGSIELRQEAMNWIKEIQSGGMISREDFPKDMKGELAKDSWDDGRFTLGMEYGAILFLMHFFNLSKEDLK